ncbi:hypothetical protein HYH02_005226 [Chlamydomonas schloesseri]|uniref:Uncharacterized protein n=1 Tax=Chlamydomonas schloesseri TaxID=2026947 RepID=A0A835WL38_9CHLO|nr:hypothetical protein HYH02_005226 [Chlamydomonas schloesseri]|eukprot:KAG2449698.1 hypothetical protein HYH02_005226 [Chlamydomonas schloesseri]
MAQDDAVSYDPAKLRAAQDLLGLPSITAASTSDLQAPAQPARRAPRNRLLQDAPSMPGSCPAHIYPPQGCEQIRADDPTKVDCTHAVCPFHADRDATNSFDCLCAIHCAGRIMMDACK